ncbi:MAG: hypothetical protein H0X37_01285 [Herpetosiphonaceae bacterium]|nr:hypothetical protein [Herpetosiphonaceae bacterium]
MDTPPTSGKERSRELHIRIDDLQTGQHKVDVRIPTNLAAVALRSGARLLPPNQDTQQLTGALDAGTPLDLHLEDTANGERIMITIQ